MKRAAGSSGKLADTSARKRRKVDKQGVYVPMRSQSGRTKDALRPSRRGRGPDSRSCACCGATNHRIEQCPLPGAIEIMKLRALVKHRRPPKRKTPTRLAGQKSKSYRAQASADYGSKEGRGRTRVQQIASTSASVVDKDTTESIDAYNELLDFRFCKKPTACPDCNGRLTGPAPHPNKKRYKGKLFLRCTRYGCRRRFNVTHFSRFKGTRLKLSQMLRVSTFYARSNRMRAPLVGDAAGQLKLPRRSIEKLYKAVRQREASAGLAFCRKKKLSGNIEGDAHGLRKIYISNSNPHFQEEILDATKRWNRSKASKGKKKPSYWQGHVRLAGLRQRDGEGVVVALPVKLVPPHASPPPESANEITNSKILKQIHAKKASVLYSDGAHGWPTSLKKSGLKKIKSVAVSHRRLQWVKKTSMKHKKPKAVKDGGTQIIDRWWQSLDTFVPPQVHNKASKGGPINQKLFDYVFGFVWRYQLKSTTDMKTAIGKLCTV